MCIFYFHDQNGNIISEHIYLGLTPIGLYKNAQLYNVHTDHLGTPRVITTNSNQVVWQWNNTDPLGANLPSVSTIEYNLRFAGQYFDKESNLHYNYYRTYNPMTGKYLQPDPIGINGGLNTYNYVNGSTLSYVDPLGLKKIMLASILDKRESTMAMQEAYKNDVYSEDVLVIYAHADTVHGIAFDTRSDFNKSLKEPYDGEIDDKGNPYYYRNINTGLGIYHMLQNAGEDLSKYKAIKIVACNVGKTNIPSELSKLIKIPVVATPDYVYWGSHWGSEEVITMGTIKQEYFFNTINRAIIFFGGNNWITY